ncbi:MAG TPA: methyltransferase [Coriobacteriia bacterium]|nr:methyltransferase [Coriobacteriia bacterium]
MLTPRENAMAIYEGRQPDYYGDFIDAITYIKDPAWLADRVPQDGRIHTDSWETEFIFLPGSPGKHPHERPGGSVINDIENWEEQLVVPDIDSFDWSSAIEQAVRIDRNERLVGVFNTAGLFERSHHLMGFEDALVNYLIHEEEVMGILEARANFKIEYITRIAAEIHPDILFFQDDWGSKTNVFLRPDLWRRMIKPLHTKIVQAAHENGMIFMHHADCYCMPLVKDMVDMGIDVWQGVIPQNDIVEVQRIVEGKLAMTGGIDGALIDVEGAGEDEIRKEVRRAIDTYCPGGRFFPGITSGKLIHDRNQGIYKDEMTKYGRRWALDHPIS